MDETKIGQRLRGVALYRAYDDAGRLLYIGVSKHWPKRWAQHADFSPWVYEVTRLEVEYFASRQQACERERQAIQAESPRWNGP